ncbi:MAG: MBL fold metallo-hydrolase [Pseudomonadales bacterium]|nr:MBL fold metallo-hydrolase [Pseudomonadales bacterium]
MYSKLGTKPYTKGLHSLGNNAYAWLQPDGGWGWSNAGLVVDGDKSLLIDTLYDLSLTNTMLNAMRDAKAGINFETLVNTHSNGDHCNGNMLLDDAEIIASKATAEEMARENPAMMRTLLENAHNTGEVGAFFLHCFGNFNFNDIEPTQPTRTYEDKLHLKVGDKSVLLKQVGPAHTLGDTLVYVPSDKLIFTGDILFIEGHPILWEGPVKNWIDACDYMLDLELETVVPGHGPITDKKGIEAVRSYLVYIRNEARKRFDTGMSAYEAAMDISLSDYDSWGDAERIVVNTSVLYKEFSNSSEPNNIGELFALMAKIHKARR